MENSLRRFDRSARFSYYYNFVTDFFKKETVKIGGDI